jgi:hypothetical protein
MIRKIHLVVLFMFLGLGLMADPPDPDGPGSGGGPLPGGGAPVDGGSVMLLTLAAVYGARKAYQLKPDKQEYTVIG